MVCVYAVLCPLWEDCTVVDSDVDLRLSVTGQLHGAFYVSISSNLGVPISMARRHIVSLGDCR